MSEDKETVELSDYEWRDQEQVHCGKCGGVLEYIISPFSEVVDHRCNACVKKEIMGAMELLKSGPYKCSCGGSTIITHGYDKYWCRDCEQYSTLGVLRCG